MKKRALFYLIIGILFFVSAYYPLIAKIFSAISLVAIVNETVTIIKKYKKKKKKFLIKLANSPALKQDYPVKKEKFKIF